MQQNQSPPTPFAPGYDVRAWAIWLLAAAAAALLARNPLYSLILLLVALLVDNRAAQRPFPWWRLAGFVVGLSTLLNFLWLHAGDTVLARLPAGWPLVGGPLTLEAAVFGAANGLLLLALLALFQAFNSSVGTADLVQLVPGALRDIGVVLLIALTYVPEMRQQLTRIRRAQAIRGHRLRGWRDWPAVAMPLLVGSLERAMTLAETMAARGYGSAAAAQPLRVRLALLLALLTILAGWLLMLWAPAWGWGVLGAGALATLGVFRWLGRRGAHVRYRPRRWTAADGLLVGTAVLALLVLLLGDRASLTYAPFPRLTPPSFHPITGLALALLALPGVWRPKT